MHFYSLEGATADGKLGRFMPSAAINYAAVAFVCMQLLS
jgi:hypothetical protein